MQVLEGERDVLGMGSVAVHDPEHGAVLAVCGMAPLARGAEAARGVDLAHDSRADPCGVGCRDDLADELVAEHACVGVVASHEFEVCAADA